MTVDWAAPAILAAGVGGTAGAVTNLVGGWLTRRQATRVAHDDQLRAQALEMADAATQVGEGHDAHEKVRSAFTRLYLCTDSVEVVQAARQLVRTSWNVQEQLAGRTRQRPSPGDIHPSKEIRAAVLTLLDAVRRETKARTSLTSALEGLESEPME